MTAVRTIGASLALLAVALTAGCAGPARPASLAAAVTGDAQVQVTGTATVSGTPDSALLSLTVSDVGGSPAAALGSLTGDAGAVLTVLHRDGVPASQVATSALSLQQNFGSGGAPDGYAASESLQVTLTPLSMASRVITDVVAAGGSATRLDGLSLNFADDSALLAAARSAAFADAKARATQYARLAGLALGRVRSIVEQVDNPTPVFATTQVNPAANAAVPVSAGSEQVSVSVQVSWQLG